MSRILIIAAWYRPFVHPRAHRWACIAEQWAEQGHEVHVVCARRRDCPDESVLNGVHVHRAGFDSLKEVVYFFFRTKTARGRVGEGVRRPSRAARIAMWLYRTFWKNIHFPDDACLWYFPARRKLKTLLQAQPFDALVSVSLPFTGHLVGWFAKGLVPTLRWLADIGDPFTIQPKPPNNDFLYGRVSKRLERAVLQKADAAVVTNAGAVRAYRARFGEVAEKLGVVPPLWRPHPQLTPPPDYPQVDCTVRNASLQRVFLRGIALRRDNPNPFPKWEGMGEGPQRSEIFHSRNSAPRYITNNSINLWVNGSPPEAGLTLGFFGALYAPTRTPDAFLGLLQKTYMARPDLPGRLHAHFFGEVFPEFFEKLSRAPGVVLHGLCSRAQAQAAMRQMNVLVNIGNTTDYQLPSKVVDYLAAGKPVLHLSYVERDPFLDFWGDTPGLLALRVHDGCVADEDIPRWVDFLEAEHPEPDEGEGLARVRKFTVPAVAAAYEVLLFSKKNSAA